LAGTLAPLPGRAQTESSGGATGGGTAGSGSAGSGSAGGSGFLRSSGFDANGEALPPQAPSLSALEAFGFPASPATSRASGRPFDWRASIGGQLVATDNINVSATNKQADVGLTLLPSISASADTALVRGFLSYAPSLSYYLNSSGQNRINNFLTANARVTLLEDRVYLQLNGFGTVNATSGGFAPVGTPQVGVGRGNQVQSYAFQAAPYYVHRFGSYGTMNVGYAYRWFDQAGSSAYVPGSTTPYFTSQTGQGNQAWMVLRSGEEFGRLLMSLRLIGTVFSGTGVYNDAHQYTASYQASYAINRWFAVLGEIGYEDARYSGVLPYKVSEMTWGAGMRLTPDEDSAIIAAVRQRDGFIAPFADVSMRLGARTRLYGNYRETLTTSGVQSLDLLNSITYDALGNPIDRFAGAPIVVPFATTPIGGMSGPLDGGIASPGGSSFGGSFLSTQSSLMKMKTGSVSISQLWERDSITLQYYYQSSNPVAVARGTTAFAQSGSSVGFTYSRLLTDTTSASAYVSYGWYNTQGTGTQNIGNTNTWTGRILLTHTFTESIFGTLQYVYTNRSANSLGSQNATQNLVLATLRKVF
jgi:uncharacterized protein (PEP-CTERM system associated)